MFKRKVVPILPGVLTALDDDPRAVGETSSWGKASRGWHATASQPVLIFVVPWAILLCVVCFPAAFLYLPVVVIVFFTILVYIGFTVLLVMSTAVRHIRSRTRLLIIAMGVGVVTVPIILSRLALILMPVYATGTNLEGESWESLGMMMLRMSGSLWNMSRISFHFEVDDVRDIDLRASV